MGQKKIKRQDFFKTLSGFAKRKTLPQSGTDFKTEDPLFKKYARKTLGKRRYEASASNNANGAGLTVRIGNVTSGLAPYTGVWTIWEVTHLLRRTGFGVIKADAEAILALTVSDAVDSLLNFAQPVLPSPFPLNYYQNILPDSGGVPFGETWVNNNLSYQNGDEIGVNTYREFSHNGWNMGVCLDDATSIREKMVHFWYHFIPINFEDIKNQEDNSATLSYNYINLLRINALGNFKNLIKAIAKSPAMLIYLGNQYSTADVPNENFGRELMELFTMGKVPAQNYNEMDVQAAAKIFSGWRVENFNAPYPFTVSFNENEHNQADKSFSPNFANSVIANQPGANGASEFDAFFDLLFTEQQTTIAKYISRRLYRFFVYYDIDANIENYVITPLAALLISSNWEMAPVMNALFKSEHFYDSVNRGVMIKSPIDFMLGTARLLKMNTTASPGADKMERQYDIWNYFHFYGFANLEQGLGYVPNVSGWKAYYQDPTYYQNWINSNTIQKRAVLLNNYRDGFYGGNEIIKFDPVIFVQQFNNAIIADPEALMNAVVEHLLSVDLPAAYKTNTKNQTLLNGQVNNAYWTNAWNNYVANPGNSAYENIVTERLSSLLTTILHLAEFQLM